METYNGQVRTPQDAIILFEACRLGLLPRVQRRLSEKERQSIRSGSVFVWDEREAGMRRWTDGKSWSASRVSGSFLTYREMEGKRGGNNFTQPSKTLEHGSSNTDDPPEGEEGPDGYRYKPDGLMKQSFSITTSQGQHLHLISYFARSHATAPGLQQPSTDPTLRSIRPQKGMYPESSVNDQSNVPAVTRSPMVGAPNYMAPQSPAYHQASQPPPGYIPAVYAQHPAYQYGPSHMHAPPYHYPMHPYPPGPHGLPPPYAQVPYGPPPPQMSQPPPAAYDQRPIRLPEGLPPPHQAHSAPPSMSQSPQQNGNTAYHHAAPAAPAPPPQQPPPRRESPRQQAVAALQIDPRLTAGAVHSPVPPTTGTAREDSNDNKENGNVKTTPASQAPTITALVNGITESGQNGEETTTTSPGGTTKKTSAIQDIPSEKLGFREDKRALRQLDKVFGGI